VGFAVKLFVPAKYTANATIYVFSTADTSSQTLNTSDRMTTDFQIIATTRPTIQMVIDELQLDQTVSQLKSDNTIKVTNPTDSHMLRISVTNRDPSEATQVANALASVMCDQIAYIMKSERPQFVEPAVMGTKSSPYVRRDAMIGGIAAALIAVLVVLVRYFVNDTITTEEDVNRYLGLTILSSVPLERNMKS
jgi:capsular polysaccharide biosynthesis protein